MLGVVPGAVPAGRSQAGRARVRRELCAMARPTASRQHLGGPQMTWVWACLEVDGAS